MAMFLKYLIVFSHLFLFRTNTSLLIDYSDKDSEHKYILIDVGKTFREQVLRWFTHHKIPQVDSVCTQAYLLFSPTI